PLDAICPYFTRFPLSFPMTYLRDAVPGEYLFDPFCGCGTSLLAARLKGLSCAGIETNPVAVAIARAKAAPATPEAVMVRAAELLATADTRERLPEGPFWQHCFSPEVLHAVCRFRTHFSKRITTGTDRVLCALLLGVLHGPNDSIPGLSNKMPASYAPSQEALLAYWTTNRLSPPEINVLEVLEKRANYLLSTPLNKVNSRVIHGDSRKQAPYRSLSGVDRVITSPPYFGLNSFLHDQWLRNWFLGNSKGTECLLDQTDTETYARDLARVWRQCASVCRPGATLVIRFGGVPGVQGVVPRTLLEDSLALADSGWKTLRCKPVFRKTNAPPALPFRPPAARPANEFELYGRLET
ncbi:MAG TPA: DNA modification methylase, partial [Candidatus Hydrogenedentes bacterium]|nr:DNA modification methylase [Candidatus Hydrogenedentota bacterium]